VAKYPAFGSLPKPPFIGGVSAIAGWNSENCGSCWELTYNGASTNVLANDHADGSDNLSLEAMNALTSGQAKALGRIETTAVQVDRLICGM
jgi:hypothetical protein